MKKLLTSIIIVLVLLLVGYYVASPYLVLNQLKNAAQDKDIDTIASYVDFGSVRTDIKEQLKGEMLKNLNEESKDNEFAAVGAMLAVSLVDGMVEQLVTPTSLQALLEGQELGKQIKLPFTNQSADTDNKNTQTTPPDWQFDTEYQSLDSFTVNVQKENSKQSVQAILKRDGLFGWKVVSIKLPNLQNEPTNP